MDSKERVHRAINHEPVDRVPTFYMSTLPIEQALMAHLCVADRDSLQERLNVDVRFVWPRLVPKAGEDRHGWSIGNVHARIHNEQGIASLVVKRPLEDATTPEEILSSTVWPNPDWYDYTIPRCQMPPYRRMAIATDNLSILLLYAMGIRGLERICIDMGDEPELARAVFRKISDINFEQAGRFLEANRGLIDIVSVGDDVAGQDGMLISPRMWREFVRPHLQKIIDLCHDYDVIPYYQGCGGFRALYNDFIQMGIRCVGRLQTEAKGNNWAEIKAEYGDRLCFGGAIDAQHILIYGSPDDVRAHVKSVLEIGGSTGFIAGPTHTFTEDTPICNILAMYDVLNSQAVRQA